MKQIILATLLLFTTVVFAQDDEDRFLKQSSEKACSCIDSIATNNTTKTIVNEKINTCISKQVFLYQMMDKMDNVLGKDIRKTINEADTESKTDTIKVEKNIVINTNEDSDEYKEYYYDLESYLMDNCVSIKNLVNSSYSEAESPMSISSRRKALVYYDKALAVSKKKNYKKAIKLYEKALEIDPNFAFAWDNIGICYRRLEQYDKAIAAYKKSIAIDPTGKMPLQNIAIVYIYTKQYNKAIAAYKDLAIVDDNNPEVFYGLGNVYYQYLNDDEAALDNMCKAYKMYVAQKSPFRSDAEKIISGIYQSMQKAGNEARFKEILKANNIKME